MYETFSSLRLWATTRSYHINLLGIIIDDQLNFKEHIQKVRKNVSRVLGKIYRCKNFIPIKSRLMLYNALILPHFNYGIELWGSTGVTAIKPLETLQKKALRLVDNKNINSPSSASFKKHKTLKISDIFKLRQGLFMYKAFHSMLPPNIQSLFKKNQTIRSTRQSNLNFTVIRRSTRMQDKRLSVAGPYFWNDLNQSIRLSNSLTMFKRNLKKTYYNLY